MKQKTLQRFTAQRDPVEKRALRTVRWVGRQTQLPQILDNVDVAVVSSIVQRVVALAIDALGVGAVLEQKLNNIQVA